MNAVFIIDNSISMRQRPCCLISLCEVAKNAVEFIMKQRLRTTESKYDTYHLLQSGFDTNGKRDCYSSMMQLLSSYKHDLLHFFFQLKNITPHLISDLPGTLRTAYKLLGTFRFLNGTDNINGGRDAMKSDPSLIILITDICDHFSLEKIQDFIKKGQMNNKWDQTLVIMQLRFPSFIEKGILGEETYRKQLQQSSQSTQILSDIANALGGMVLLVDSQEQMFSQIDSQIIPLFNKLRLNLLLQMQCRTDQETPGFVESGIKDVHNPISNPLLPSKEVVLLKLFQKPNKGFQQVKYKSEIQNHQYSRILLPDKPAKVEEKTAKELKSNEYPKFIVNFGKIFHANMNKDLEFERQEIDLGEWSKLISPQIAPYIKDKAYFPIYASSELKFNFEEGHSSSLTLVGLLKVNCREGEISGIDMLFNIWNFIEFNSLYEDILSKKSLLLSSQSSQAALAQTAEQELGQRIEKYIQATPLYYLPMLKKILQEKGLSSLLERKTNFLYSETILSPEFQEFCKQILKHLSKERKKMDEAARQNKQKHLSKKSSCCASSNDNYETLNRGIHPKNPRKLQLESLILMKEEVLNNSRNAETNQKNTLIKKKATKDWEDSIKRITFKSEPVSKMSELSKPTKQLEFKDACIDEDEFKVIKEPMPFGNPFKFIVRVKNSKYNGQQSNELLANEDSYLNSSVGQQYGNKNSQNLFVNRLPKLRKLKGADEPVLRKKLKYDSILMEDADSVTPAEEEVAPMLYDDYSASLPSYYDGSSETTKRQLREEEDIDDEEECVTNKNFTLEISKSSRYQNGNSRTNKHHDEQINDLELNCRQSELNRNCGVEQEELEDEDEQEFKENKDESLQYNSKNHKQQQDSGYNPEQDEKIDSHSPRKPNKKYAYNDLVFGNTISSNSSNQKASKTIYRDFSNDQEYNPESMQEDTTSSFCSTSQKSKVKVEFSTKYLISQQKKQQQFLLEEKDFFQKLLIIQQTYSRNDLKLFVLNQLKQITNQEFLEVFKQRVSEIVYIDKPSNSSNHH